MKNKLSTATLAFAVFAGSALAANDPISMTVDNMPHEFFGNYGIDYMVGSYYGASDWPTFTSNLSTATSLIFELNAPVGKAFQFTASPNSIGVNLFIGSTTWTAAGASFAGVKSFLPTAVSFTNFSGVAAGSSSVHFKITQDGKGLSSEGYLAWLGVDYLSFTGIRLKVDVSSLVGKSFVSQSYVPNGFGARFQDVFSPIMNTDPGASLRLTSAVPEPSSLMLLLGGYALLLLASAAKRKKQSLQE